VVIAFKRPEHPETAFRGAQGHFTAFIGHRFWYDEMVTAREKKLPRSIVLLGWVSFFSDVSSEMTYPLLPMYVVSVLGASTVALGFIEGMSQVVISVMAAVSGFVSNRASARVPLVRLGYGLPILGKALIAVAWTWHLLFLGRLIDRFGKGVRGTPRDVLIAEAVEPARRGEAFGFHRAMDTAGACVGVFLAALVLWWFGDAPDARGFRIALLLAAVLAAGSLFVSLWLRDGSSGGLPAEGNEGPQPIFWGSVRAFLFSVRGLGRRYWITLSIMAVFSFANSSDTFLLLKASKEGIAPEHVVLLYALYNVSYAALSLPAGRLSDRLGRWSVVGLGWLVYAVVYACVALFSGPALWPIFLVYGCYMAMTEGVSKALVVDSVDPGNRGTAIGVLYLFLGLSALTSNLVAGAMWHAFGSDAPFWLGSGVALMAGVVALALCRRMESA